ncbi:hypothetical protein C4580_02795 [Candidatus Woesearchaeota archaeon]|nr:MAG: hypothetical protein C4580_02795 [Candidatus Woesearchaeota archaeon]
MTQKYHVFWELLLILSSVLIFRSTWLFLDKFLSSDAGLALSLLAGLALAALAIYQLYKHG